MSLSAVIRLKKEALEDAMRRLPLAELKARVEDTPRPRGLPKPPALPGPAGGEGRKVAGHAVSTDGTLLLPEGTFPLIGGGIAALPAGFGMNGGLGSPGQRSGGVGGTGLLGDPRLALAQPELLASLLEADAAGLLSTSTGRAPTPRDIHPRAGVAGRPVVVPELKRRALPGEPSRRDRPDGRSLEQAFAQALQVDAPWLVLWTEACAYGGRVEDLEALRAWRAGAHGEGGPSLLRAELVLSPWQLYETRLRGGDGTLAVAAALTRGQLEELLGVCGELGLTLLAYVNRPGEVERAVLAGVEHVAVGAGDLFEAVDRREGGAGPLGEVLREVPAGGWRVAWGGVKNEEEWGSRGGLGANAVVVGRGLTGVMGRRGQK